jgi:hypothetical protein
MLGRATPSKRGCLGVLCKGTYYLYLWAVYYTNCHMD